MKAAEKVRKQFILDSKKIEKVKRLTHAKTETDAINSALDMVITNDMIEKSLKSIKGKGNILDVYNRVSS